MVYSLEQNTFIIMAYYRNGVFQDDQWTFSVSACKNEYMTKFPEENLSEAALVQHIRDVVDRFVRTGNVSKGKSSGRPPVNDEVVEDVRNRLEQSPNKSLTKLSLQANVPRSTCHKIAKKMLHFHPYRLTSVQELRPEDFESRRNYCNWFLNNLNQDELLDLSFYSDEAWFHLSGYVNSQNFRYWSAENPHIFVEAPLHPIKVGVWVAVSRRRLIGPIFFHDTINAQRYQEQLLEPFINQLHDDELQLGYFQQDGATAHTANATLAYLQNFFDDRIISRGLPTEWPPRSPDLTPLDFSVFGYLKNEVFKRRLHNLNELMEEIVNCCNNINQEMLQRIFENKRRRIRMCLDQNGGHFQHYL